MAAYTDWKAENITAELDTRLDNAFKRVSGSIGYDISYDGGRSKAMRDTVSSVVQAGMDTPGPLFLRLGSGLLEGNGLNIGSGVSPRDVAAEIMQEFYSEGNAAFQTVKAAFYASAAQHLKSSGLEADARENILAAAGSAFSAPVKDEFMLAAKPLCEQALSPSSILCIGGVLGFILPLVLIRVPHIAVAGALIGAGLGYYMGRNRQRVVAARVAQRLPRILYDLLQRKLLSNSAKYENIVNSSATKLLN